MGTVDDSPPRRRDRDSSPRRSEEGGDRSRPRSSSHRSRSPPRRQRDRSPPHRPRSRNRSPLRRRSGRTPPRRARSPPRRTPSPPRRNRSRSCSRERYNQDEGGHETAREGERGREAGFQERERGRELPPRSGGHAEGERNGSSGRGLAGGGGGGSRGECWGGGDRLRPRGDGGRHVPALGGDGGDRDGGRQHEKGGRMGDGRRQESSGGEKRGDGGERRGSGRGDEVRDGGDEADGGGPPAEVKVEPNFGVSGKLAAETNEVNGVVMKFQPPPEARRCTNPRWRLYVFKGDNQVGDPLPLDKFPYFLFGKERRVADVPTDHPSCSRQHAVICFREVEKASSLNKVVVPYIIDLETVNGTFVNGARVEPSRFVELLERDVIRFGLSSREYVLLNDKSAG